jgi:cytochrome c-type biogenesis protein CcmF
MEINYIGEHSWVGSLGNFFLVLSFTASLMSAIAYYIAARKEIVDESWTRLGRFAFRIHSLSVLGIMAVLFVMLSNHYFEYQYAWRHSNRIMPMKYILSCFWEGQEGSFLLWTLWHVILGNILIRTSKEWEAPVMTIFAMVQVFLTSMLLGIYIGSFHLGSNPFLLMREMPENIGMPWTKMSTYLQKLPLFQNPMGLNPLLQNYWMTIHPPTLFLGFASTLVPFAYAIAGLWKKRLTSWQKHALPWTFFGIMILGTGILMGGAWAYESLTFGGFWAWDPVENASLVPWLTFVGAGHVMLVNKNRHISLFTTFFLTIITFILVLYSTFLTRSGILSTTSVHAFTDLGMAGQLMIYLLFFVWLSVALLILNSPLRIFYTLVSILILILSVITGVKAAFVFFFAALSIVMLLIGYKRFFPKDEKEEALWSREFWMFIGALILLIASFQIILYTSFPVVNKIINIDFIHYLIGGLNSKLNSWFHYSGLSNFASGKLAPERDAKAFYNKWQALFASLVAIGVAFGQYLRYKDTPFRDFARKLILPLCVSLALTVLIGYNMPNWNNLQFALNEILLFSALFAILANIDYWRKVARGKISKSGSSIAHIGFGLILLGALISNSNQEVISRNVAGDLSTMDKSLSSSNNILLTKGDTLPMGPYFVTYNGRRKEGIYIYFDVEYLTKQANGKFKSSFLLSPLVQLNDRMGNVPEPSTEHFLTRDIYTHVTMAEVERNPDESPSDYTTPVNKEVARHDTIFTSNCIMVLDSLTTRLDRKKFRLDESTLAVQACFHMTDINKKLYTAGPVFTIRNNESKPIEDTVSALGIKLNFWKVDPQSGKISVYVSEKKANKRDFVVMEAMIFPWINILWIGCLVMVTGTIIAMRERLHKLRSERKPESAL